MNRSAMRALVALGAAVVLSGATAGAVALTQVSSAASDPAPTASTVDVQRYWSDTKAALAPLLLYVRVLPETRTAVERSGGRINGGQRHLAEVMANGFGTARQNVSGLQAPASTAGDVEDLMQIACRLYQQSALTLLDLRSHRATENTLRRSAALQTIGDRVIDQVRRVLDIDGLAADAAHVELRYAPAVPALSELTQAGESALRAAAAALARSPATGENVVGARLAILLAVVAEDARSAGSPTGTALFGISKDLWGSTRTLSGATPTVDLLTILGG